MPEPESYITINDTKCPRHESRLRGSRGTENGGTKADEKEGEKVACGGEKSGGEGKGKGEEIDNGKGKGQKKGKQKGEMEMEKTGGKRKRKVDDEGEEGAAGLEEGKMRNENKDADKHGGEAEAEGDNRMEGVEEQNEDQMSRSESSSASVKPKSKGKTKAEEKERGKTKEPRGKRQSLSTQPQPPSQPAPAPEPALEPEADTSSLFFIDLTPTAIPTVLIDTTPAVALDTSIAPDAVQDTKLLVPAHVTIIEKRRAGGDGKGNGEEDGEAGEEEEEEEEGIEYLDYDDDVRAWLGIPNRKSILQGITRYFDDPADLNAAAQSRRTVCKNCGAEGEHKTAACPVRICLMCGARDEHSTWLCPITKVCFTCGMKGHINATLRARYDVLTRPGVRSVFFSSFHKTNECPTCWRIYEYFSEAQQHTTLERRLENKGLWLGKGGEAYIADDEDCDDARVPPNDHSAFSAYNVMKSPFWDPTSESQHKKSKSATTPRHVDDYVNEQWRGDVLDEVGRKGRVKARLALQKREERDEDEDDWFGSRSRARGEPKKIRFGFSLDGKKKAEQGSLLARLDVPSGNDFARSEKRDEKSDRHRHRHSGGSGGRGNRGSEKSGRGGSDKSSKRDRDREEKDKSWYRDWDRRDT
ncbi:hypothetical protein BJ165DRAFT_1398354 [Panaeolus papilionaceus]|nr:hypothetical protein BJ165DRAFT_1398354 [Panaeolus papilionaceus]